MFSIERQQLSDLQWQINRVSRVLPPDVALQYLLLEVQLDLKAKNAIVRLLPGLPQLHDTDSR